MLKTFFRIILLAGTVLTVAKAEAGSVTGAVSAEDVGAVLDRELSGYARIIDLGCEVEESTFCHTIVRDIRVVASAPSKAEPASFVAIEAPIPFEEDNLIIIMGVIAAMRPTTEKPEIGAAVEELVKKAARLSRDPSVEVDGARLSIEVTKQSLFIGVAAID